MRHYEVVILIHPDQSAQSEAMVGRYRDLIEQGQGTIHRCEDWGRRHLAYPINKVHKAHYYLLNIECDQATLEKLEGTFRYNDAIIRHMTIRQKNAITERSPLAKTSDKPRREREAAPAAAQGDAANSSEK